MTEHLNDRSDPHQPLVIKDRVVVRDDSKLAGATMLGALVAILLAGGALVYALSGPHDTTSVTAPTPERSDATVGQGQRAPAPKAQ